VSPTCGVLSLDAERSALRRRGGDKVEGMNREELEKLVITLEEEMFQAAEELRFSTPPSCATRSKSIRR